MTELDLFSAAIGSPDPAARAALLDRECADDPALRERLDKLLAAHFAAHPLLDPVADVTGTFGGAGETVDPEAAPTADYPGKGEYEGAVLAGRYQLSQRIGEGGMGSVWLAHQSEPVKRKVAVKLIKAGMDSKAVLARFEAERQALAVMDHPNIAKVLDGGLHDGRPYFVMELVKGVPITEYCDARKLTPKERLELFVPVCQAIQHAHQKGIIHRDIKPSNVLIALYDDKPVPKVIDFGIAKATGGTLTEKTIETAFGGVVGTPQYMSPEQASLNNLDIDTRSDVYSLGVLLYELLTGSPPFKRQELEQRGLLEILRVVREEEAPRPSVKLSTADALPSLAANRGTEPKKLTGLLRNELDWIVMKALEKDRTRRYETANGFAADVTRYLSGEAVQAHPPSAAYRVKKFVRRNRVQVMAAGLVLFALLAGIAGTTYGLIRAEQASVREKKRADGEQLAKVDAENQKALALASEATARKRLTQIEKANDILGSVFENLDPMEIARAERPLQAILVEKLDRAVAQLEGESIGDPLVVAAMQVKFGVSLVGLAEPGKAVVPLEKARATFLALLSPEHPDTLHCTYELAWAHHVAGNRTLALPLFIETLRLRKAKLGPDHSDTLHSMNDLALAYQAAGMLNLALPLLEETVDLSKAKLGPDDPQTLTGMNNLAEAYRDAGKLNLAVPIYEETWKLRKTNLGPNHPHTLISMDNLAKAYGESGKLGLALPLSEETLKLRRATLGPEHLDTLTSMNNLAVVYRQAGKHDLALPLFEETLKLRRAKLGPEHPNTLTSMSNLAVAYRQAWKLDLALPLFEETLKLRRAKLGPEHSATLTSMSNLGRVYCDANQGEKAVATLKEFVTVRRNRAAPDDPQFAGVLTQFALELSNCQQHIAAEEMLREALGIREKKEPDAWTTFNTRSLLGGSLLGQKKYADAEPLLVKGYEGMKVREKAIPPQGDTRIPEALDRLIELYTATKKPDEVKKYRDRRAKYPPELAPPPKVVK